MPVNVILPPDSFCISSAEGWIILGNPIEAIGELEQVSNPVKLRPEYLELKWRVFADTQEWDAALELSEGMVRDLPDHPGGFILRSYALRRSSKGSVEQATRGGGGGGVKFPSEPIIPYNLACYACQSGELVQARKFLRLALEIGDRKELLKMAGMDSDLKSLWNELKSL